MGTLRSLVVFTRTAPFPASPSHPAAPAILSTLKAAQKGYADMRGIWSRKCLETQGKRSIDRADTIDSIVAGKDFGRWLESLLSVADEEYGCIKDLSPLNIPNVVASPYNALLNPNLFLFSTKLTSLIALIKRSPRTRRCLRCSRAGTRFAPDSRNFNANERKTGWARCGRSSPEFLADIEMELVVKNDPGTETSVGVSSYLTRADDVTTAISSLTANSRTGRCTCETTSSSPRPVRRDIPLRLNSTPSASPRPPQLPSAPRLRPPAAVRHCARLLIKIREVILHRPSPAARVVHNGLQQQREARVEVRCGPALAEAAAAAQRVLHALREEVVVVVLLLSAVLETSSLYRTSEIYQAIEPSDGVGR